MRRRSYTRVRRRAAQLPTDRSRLPRAALAVLRGLLERVGYGHLTGTMELRTALERLAPAYAASTDEGRALRLWLARTPDALRKAIARNPTPQKPKPQRVSV
jgi:hypothetical protein